jgi:hypothetical protein
MSSDRGAVRAIVRRIALHALAIGAFFAMGCAPALPRARFHVLSNSGARILATTNETYARIARLEDAFIVASAGDEKLTPDSFRPVIEGRSFDLLPELAIRSQALTVLVHYFDVLEAFATNDAAGVDEAALELGASVRSLMDAAGTGEHAKEVSGILATGIDVIGKEITAGQRAGALERVMAASQKDVERLAELVGQSHAKLERAIDVMVAQIVARANVIRPPAGSALRDEFHAALYRTLRDARAARASLAEMAEALRGIPGAHAQIQKSLREKATPLDALQALASRAERAGRFYALTQPGENHGPDP